MLKPCRGKRGIMRGYTKLHGPRIDWGQLVGLVLLATLVVLFAVFLGVTGHDRSELKDVESRLRSQFPHNQIEMTSRQVLTTIENIYGITEFIEGALASMDPAWVGELVHHVNALLNETETAKIQQLVSATLDKALAAVDQVNPAELANIVTNTNRVLAGIDPVEVNALVANLNKLVGDIDGKVIADTLQRIDALVTAIQDQHLLDHLMIIATNVQEITDHLKTLNEVKIQL